MAADQKQFPYILDILKKTDSLSVVNLSQGEGKKTNQSVKTAIYKLLHRAHEVQEEYWRMGAAPFSPRCLTITVGKRCDLVCPYCFSKEFPFLSHALSKSSLNVRAIKAAARLVANNCLESGESGEKGNTFSLVVHGGGEPTMYVVELMELMKIITAIKDLYHMKIFSYIATNGTAPDVLTDWLVANFSLIGLSCDGPPDVHDRQRPFRFPILSSEKVEQFVRRLQFHGHPFHVRATITPESMTRQVEIVEYMCRVLGATQIRFEPVYRMPKNNRWAFSTDQAPEFVQHFLAAQEKARQLGCRLSISGVRPGEIYGPHCNVFKNVLQLTPEGLATPCFLYFGDIKQSGNPWVIGKYNPESDEFILEEEKIGSLSALMAEFPKRCNSCFNQYHCTRLCPENDPQHPGLCPVPGLENADPETKNGDFRCLIQRQLAEAWILKSVEHLLDGPLPILPLVPHASDFDQGSAG